MPVLLACGFTPLHLLNYFAAYLQQGNPERKVRVQTGLYGDLPGTLANFAAAGTGTAAVVLEWFDLDPRLGYRQTGGWGQRVVPSILESVTGRLNQLAATIGGISSSAKLIVSLPTLDLPPAFHTSGWQASEAELTLRQSMASFAARIVSHPSVVVLNEQKLAQLSPPAERYDFRADLNTGFPYTTAHADALGGLLARMTQRQEPKKGLITDLDDTLWQGLVGEIGPSEVCWDLANHAQIHGLYQQILTALAEQGVLVAIASKNSAEVVEQALNRSDLVVDKSKIFPVEVHWNAKSGSVQRILKAWNISADAVVFVDDSALELAEVKAAHPGLECLLFPKSDYAAAFSLFQQLRDLFGKARLSEEDSFRLESIRQGQQFAALANDDASHDLLATVEAVLTFDMATDSADKRTLELINKTNQFNLNGRRYTDEEWHETLLAAETFVLSVSYQDKFGPLGKIAALKGSKVGNRAKIDVWVMSCRAFSRQIEFQTLLQVFERLGVEELNFQYVPTAKNGPLGEFLERVFGEKPSSEAVITSQRFQQACPTLYHQVNFKQ